MLTLAENSVIKIRDLVISGKYRPGQMLSQRKVSQLLGVSPIVVRESMRVLEKEGLVENIPKWGTRVVPFDLNKLKGQYLIREALEGMAARIVCEKTTRQETLKLYKMADNLDRMFKKGDVESRKINTAHYQLHRYISELCGHDELLVVLDRINIQQLIWFTDDIVNLKEAVPLSRWHHKLIDALAGRNPDKAEQFMRLHVRKGLESILESLPKIRKKAKDDTFLT